MSTRTQKSIKNIYVSLTIFIIESVLKFISRSIFIEYLGAEILGLNTTIWNILNFLNLAELGVGTAITVTLYKPLLEQDRTSISEIVSLQGHFYKWISIVIIIGALIVMGFFPWIFEKAEVPGWTIYATFLVLLFSSLIGNFVNYRQTLLIADQRKYKVAYSYQSVMIIKRIVQILVICYLSHGYVWWLIVEAVFAVIGSLSLRWITNKEYPYLLESNGTFKDLRKKYSSVSTKIRQLIYHNITGFIVRESTPLIIYGFISLTEVTVYGNYMVVITGIYQIGNMIYYNIMPSLGNLVVEGDMIKIVKIYKELFVIRFIFSGIVVFGLILFMDPFITLWVGKEFLLSNRTLWILVGFLFIRLNRVTVDLFINAYGLFDDIKSPILEGITNLTLAIVGGYYWGLNGIIVGGMIGTSVVVLIWKPYYLFLRGFNLGVKIYYYLLVKCLSLLVVVMIPSVLIIERLYITPSLSWSNFIVNFTISCGIFSIILFAIFYKMSFSMRQFVHRFI